MTRTNPISDQMYTEWVLSRHGVELARMRTSRKLVGHVEKIVLEDAPLDSTSIAVIEGLCRAIKSLELPP